MTISSIVVFVTKGIASFALSKGLNRLFDSKEDLESRLLLITKQTIKLFEEKYPINDIGDIFPFYGSSAILEAMLKFRLFPTEDFDSQVIYNEIEKNSRIIKPTKEEISLFLSIFNDEVEKDTKLKQIEIDENYKERIFILEKKIDQINETLQLQLIEVVPLLQEEYKEELDECYKEIKSLKFKTALRRLELIESRTEKNAKHVPVKLNADLLFYKALCLESLAKETEAHQSFIAAYKLSADNQKYISRACLSYYTLKDEKFKDLKNKIEEKNDYNIDCWFIKVMEAIDKIDYIRNSVPQTVLDDHRFKRLIFNRNLKCQFADSVELLDLLAVDCSNLPTTIDYDNIYHWLFILNATSIYFFHNEPIMFTKENVKDHKNWIHFYKLLVLISDTVNNGEFNDDYSIIHFLKYWIECEIDMKEDTIKNLKDKYNKIPKKELFYTFLLANSLQKFVDKQTALSFIEANGGILDRNLKFLRVHCQLQIPSSNIEINDLFSSSDSIDIYSMNQICLYLEPILETRDINRTELIEYINNANYTNANYKLLLEFLVESSNDSPSINVIKINELAEKLKDEPLLFSHISFIYFKTKNYEECISFIKSYLDESVVSHDMFVYIEALYQHKKDKQTELLRVLKHWRKNFIYIDKFLRMEINLRHILGDWTEIYEISRYALDKTPKDEPIFVAYLLSLFNLNHDEELELQLENIMNFDFKITENVINISRILYEKGALQESLDLLYEKAKNTEDILARTTFVTATLNFPNEYFVELEEVSEGTYVRFEIDGEMQHKYIDAKKGDQITIGSLGKKKGEVFSISKISNVLREVKVVRIMNKYLALSDQIYTEAGSSFSNLPLESIKIRDFENPEEFKKQFIELFGQSEKDRKNHFEENIKKYNNYSIFYGELVSSNFKGNYIDTYYYLTSSQSNGFVIFPVNHVNQSIDLENKKLVLDFTSALLFHELEKKLNIKFEKFIVSKSMMQLIEVSIQQAKEASKSKMSVNIVGDQLIPYFYSDDFHEKRIKFIEDFFAWILEHTEAITPEEKIDIMRPLYDEGKIEPHFECMVDIVLLGQRDGYNIISDDISFRKLMPFISNKIASTELFLLKMFPEKITEIYEFLLQQRYVGLSISKEVLYSAYINQNKKELEHIFQYAVRNITLKETFSIDQIHILVDFMRDIALNPLITPEKYLFDVTNLFVMMLKAITNSKDLLQLQIIIESKFKLLEKYKNITKLAVIDAMRIFDPSLFSK